MSEHASASPRDLAFTTAQELARPALVSLLVDHRSDANDPWTNINAVHARLQQAHAHHRQPVSTHLEQTVHDEHARRAIAEAFTAETAEAQTAAYLYGLAVGLAVVQGGAR